MKNPKIPIEYGSELEGFYFQHLSRKSHYERNNHYHAAYEIYFLISGNRHYFIKDRFYLAQAGDIIFINKYDVHKTLPVDHLQPEHERVLVNFSEAYLGISHLYQTPSLLNIFQSTSNLYRLSPHDIDYVRYLFNRMAHEVENKEAGFEIYLRLLLTELLLFSERLDNKYPLLTEVNPSSLHGRITQVVKYIDANFSEKISLEQVAQLVFISPAYLSRNFRAITGFTFVGYIQHVRIRHAKHLLLESNKKMSEIAAAVGFDNFTHFNRTFKKLVLTNPLKYRMDNKTHQKN